MGRKSIGVLASFLAIVILLIGMFGCKSSKTTATTPATSTTSSNTLAATTSKTTTTTTTATKSTDKTATTTTTSTTKTTTTTTSASGQTLGDILGRSAGVSSMQYEMLITAPGAQPITQKIFVKKNKMRMEMTQAGLATVILLDMDAKTMYSYMPSQNMAIKMTFNPTTKSAVDEAQSISNYNPVVMGNETIDGKVCTVVQYTASGQTVKMWLWQERGLPIRVEATTVQGTTIMEYKNLEFVDIADSMFELPEGVLITTLGT